MEKLLKRICKDERLYNFKQEPITLPILWSIAFPKSIQLIKSNMRKKRILPIIALFLAFIGFSQESGEIEFRVKVSDKNKTSLDSIREVNPERASLLEKGLYRNDKVVPFLSYRLIFNKNESVFERNIGMERDSGPSLSQATKSVGAIGSYYIDVNKKLRLQQRNFLNTDWLIEKNIGNLNWQIEEKKKIIEGYSCQKAKAFVNLNSVKKDFITAWFCPEIPFQHGPMGYGGLPGMILELSIRHYTLYSNGISFSDKPKEIKKPTKGRNVSWEEYNKEIKTRIQKIFDDG